MTAEILILSLFILFAGGILPGVLMGISLIGVGTFISWKKGYGAATRFSIDQMWQNFKRAILALGTPVIILGGILFGIFTATESAAVAIVYALFIGMFAYKKIKIKDLPRLFRDGAITSSIVMFIIATASIFSWITTIEDIPASIAGTLLGMTKNPVILLLIAGIFVETTAALILLVPMITAMVSTLGIDMVQLGVIVVTNLAIGMLTPPMGICLDCVRFHFRRQPGCHQQAYFAIFSGVAD